MGKILGVAAPLDLDEKCQKNNGLGHLELNNSKHAGMRLGWNLGQAGGAAIFRMELGWDFFGGWDGHARC